MKRKILFVMESLGIGGAEKSLLTILSMLDYQKYDVDLFLFRTDGELMEFLPSEVKVLKASENYHIFSKNRKMAPLRFLKKLDFKRAYHSLLYLIKCWHAQNAKKLYIGWEHVKVMFDEINQFYDTSVAFLERKTIYFNSDKVKAKHKIGFVHNDYSTYAYDYEQDKKYFKDYQKIATVSQHCQEVLEEIFPEYREKFVVVKNMVSKKVIQQMAEEKLELLKEKTTIVTVGRLVKQKGMDRAIVICKKLIEQGYFVKWYVIGAGPEEKDLQKKIREKGLQDIFILVGAQKNPYPWMRNCDIYVQPSRFEGFGITVCEAKALAKPMVVSDIPEFREQILDGVNGYIAKNDEMMYDKIVELIENKKGMREQFITFLEKDESIENKEELKKLCEILEERE